MADPVVICTKSLCDGWFEERVTFDVSDGRALLMRQERQLRSEMDPSLTTLNVWETDPDAGVSIPREALAALVLSALPHLTGDELRRVAEAMPRVAGEWTDRSVTEIGDATGDRMERPAVGHEDIAAGFVRRHSDGERWVAISTGPYCYTTHPTAREAQAACDARLEAAGVRLCGEVVRDG